MPLRKPEEQARGHIDAMLVASGWAIQNYKEPNLGAARGIATHPDRVKGRSQPGRFADLVALVRFSLEQQPVLEPFADSVRRRFDLWLTGKQSGSRVPPLDSDKSRDGSTVFTPEQLAWLELIRDHIATSVTVEPDDFEFAPFSQRGGLGRAHQLFGSELPNILDELNRSLVA